MSLLVLIVAGLVLGTWVLRPLRLQGGVEGAALRVLVGLILCAVLILVVGSVSLRASRLVLIGLAIAGLALELLYSRRGVKAAQTEPRPRCRRDVLEWICLAAVAGGLGLSLIGAIAPATDWDACVAHLALPMDYAREGRILLVPGNEYAAYPHLVHSLFAQVYFTLGELGANLLNWVFGALACAAAYGLGRRVQGRRCGVIAAAILATAPVFLDQAAAASVDLAFCGLTLAALLGLMAWRDEGRTGLLLLAAFLAGGSCGVRHTGYLVCAFLAVGVFAVARGRRLRDAGAFAVAALVGAAPWLLRSAVLVGNPVYPFFISLFGPHDAAHWNVTALAAHGTIRGTGLGDLLLFPWDIVMRPEQFDGWTKSPGGLVLFLGIPGLVVGGRRARALGAFAGAGLVSFFYFQRFARYLLPFLAPMMVVAGAAVCRLTTLRHAVAGVLVAALGFGLALDAAAVHFKVPVILGLESRTDYLTRRVERYPAFKWASENLPSDEVVLSFDRRTYYLGGRTWQNDVPFQTLCDQSLPEQIAWMKAHDIQWVFLPVTYVEESRAYRGSMLEMLRKWRISRQHFTPVYEADLPRPRAPGTERVEVYEVRYD